MGYFYALKDLDWPWDDQDEGRTIVVEATTPEEAVRIATERHLQQSPGAGGVTWSVARVEDIGFGDAEWEDDNAPVYGPFTTYGDVTESLGSQIDRLANFIMAEVPGEPSQSEGAVDTAIRWMRAALASQAAGEPTREQALEWAKEWHRVVEVTCTMMGLSPALSASESIAAIQAKLSSQPAGEGEAVAFECCKGLAPESECRCARPAAADAGVREALRDDTLEVLRAARSALDRLYEGFLHNSEAGCEAWDDASGFEVCSALDGALFLAAKREQANG